MRWPLSNLVPYPEPLRKSTFVKRYKRFLMDVILENGKTDTIHCANSGSMKSCLEANAITYSLDSHNPNRKLRHSLELMELTDGLACLNTSRANQLIHQLIEHCLMSKKEFPFIDPSFYNFLRPFKSVLAEKTYKKGTRFDFQLFGPQETGWIEVKSVSLRETKGVAFPDAITVRGQKHLRDLMEVKQKGHAAALIFVIMRGQNDDAQALCRDFAPAEHIDPQYAQLLSQARDCGVSVFTVASHISLKGLGVRCVFSI